MELYFVGIIDLSEMGFHVDVPQSDLFFNKEEAEQKLEELEQKQDYSNFNLKVCSIKVDKNSEDAHFSKVYYKTNNY